MTGGAEERESVRLGEYIWTIYRHKWVILFFLLVSVGLSIYRTARTTPVYRSSATFIYDATSQMAQTLEMPNVFWFEMDQMRNNQIQIIQSRSMAEAVADSILTSPNTDSLVSLLFGGRPVPAQNLRGALIGMVRGNTSVSVLSETDFFVLSANGPSPAAAATLANLTVHTYYRQNLDEARSENAMVRDFLQQQIALIQAELELDEQMLRDFREEEGVVDLQAETSALVTDLSAFETAAATASTEQGALEAQRDYYAQQLDLDRSELESTLGGLSNTVIEQLELEISVLVSARASLLAEGVPEGDPAVQSVEADMAARTAALQEALEEAALSRYPDSPTTRISEMMAGLATIEAELRGERLREAVFESIAAELEDSMLQLPELELELARLQRNRTVSEQIYLMLRTKYEEVRIAEAGQMGNVRIVDTALPGGMIVPNSRKNLILGIFVGLVLGVGFVLLKERIDQRVKNPEDIEQLGIPVIGVVPKMSRAELRTETGRMGLIMMTGPRKAASEAYRDLRTSLRFSGGDEGIGTLLVTSAGPREGKSTTAGNLAVAIAQAGDRVLIVDTDLRRPVIHNIFDITREPGFSEVIAGIEQLDSVIRETGVANLQAMTSGYIPHNPSELIGGARFGRLLEELRSRYDMVIFDSPPAAVVTDAMLLAPEMDATVVVVGAKIVNRKVLKSAWGKLDRSNARLVGALLNGFDPLKMYTSYSYYTYRYHYYYDGKQGGTRRSGRGRSSRRRRRR